MAWYFFPKLIAAFIAIFVLVILSRVLGPEDFGRYNITILFGTIVYSFVFAWLAIVIIRFHSSEQYDGKVIAYALHTSARIAIWSAPVIILAGFLAPPQYVLAVVLGALFAMAHATQELGLAAFRVYRQGPAFAFVTLIRPIVAVALSVTLALMGFGFVGAVVGAITGALLAGGISMYFVLPKSGAEPPEFHNIKQFLVYGMPLGIVTSGSMLIVLLSQSLIATYVDIAAVGIFAAAQTLAMRSISMPMIMLSRASGALIFSEYEEAGTDAANRVLARHFSFVLLLSAPIATALIFANKTAAWVMFGEAYKIAASEHLPILVIAAFIIGVQGAYFAYAFTVSGKTYTQLYILAGSTVLHAGITAIAIQALGSIGASVAMLITAMLSAYAYYYFGKRNATEISLPLRPVWKTLVASAAMAPFAAYADTHENLIAAIGLVVLGGLAYLAVLIMLRQTGIMAVLAALRRLVAGRRAK